MALVLDGVHHGAGMTAQRRLRVDAGFAAGGGQFKKFLAGGLFVEAARGGGNGGAVHHAFGGQVLFDNLLEDLAREEEGRQLRRQVLEEPLGGGAVFLFGGLDGIPLLQHGVGVGQIDVAKNMRMAANELVVDFTGHVVEIELAGLGGHLRVHDDVKEQIAQFLAHVGEIVAVNGVEQFGHFLDQAVADALMGLFDVPRAAPRAAQPRHRVAEVVNRTHVVEAI